jgi:hypothetical protein
MTKVTIAIAEMVNRPHLLIEGYPTVRFYTPRNEIEQD